MAYASIAEGRAHEDMESMILRELALDLSRMFPSCRIAPMPPLRLKNDGQEDEYGLTSSQEALRLYMSVVADFFLFSSRTAGWFVPEPLYGLARGQWGVKIEELLCTGPFHIGIAWVDHYGLSEFEPELRRFLERIGHLPCTR